jgi:hypothetical protein
MSSSVHLRFPLSLKTRSYRWPAVRAFALALVVAGVSWGLVAWRHLTGEPTPSVWFPLATALAVASPVVVLAWALARARRARRHYDFDTIVYADSSRVVLSHSLKGGRYELFEGRIHAWLLVHRPASARSPVTATKLCCLEVVDTDGDVLRSEPLVGPTRLRRVLRDLNVAFTERDEVHPLPR